MMNERELGEALHPQAPPPPTPEELAEMAEAGVTEAEVDEALQLPKPVGYKLLIALPEPEERTAGGIIKAKQTLETEQVASVCGLVLEMGADAYKDEKRFPHGPYCQVGDWIMMRAYSGTRFKVNGKEFRLINDESVEGVVADPRGVMKV